MPKAVSRGRSLVWCAGLALGASICGGVALAASSSQAAAAAGSDAAHASGPINWRQIEHGAPIPHQIPVVLDADTGLAAGFVPQWIERSITQWPPSMADPDLPAKEVLRIAKGERRHDDRWAQDMAQRLRSTLQMSASPEAIHYVRIFCGSVGCLCYYETSDASSLEPYSHARSGLLHGLLDDNGWGHAAGIAPVNVQEVGTMGVWELIYILRGKAKT